MTLAIYTFYKRSFLLSAYLKNLKVPSHQRTFILGQCQVLSSAVLEDPCRKIPYLKKQCPCDLQPTCMCLYSTYTIESYLTVTAQLLHNTQGACSQILTLLQYIMLPASVQQHLSLSDDDLGYKLVLMSI